VHMGDVEKVQRFCWHVVMRRQPVVQRSAGLGEDAPYDVPGDRLVGGTTFDRDAEQEIYCTERPWGRPGTVEFLLVESQGVQEWTKACQILQLAAEALLVKALRLQVGRRYDRQRKMLHTATCSGSH
jgi:hypothetical protein